MGVRLNEMYLLDSSKVLVTFQLLLLNAFDKGAAFKPARLNLFKPEVVSRLDAIDWAVTVVEFPATPSIFQERICPLMPARDSAVRPRIVMRIFFMGL